jgi:hypothetical protein
VTAIVEVDLLQFGKPRHYRNYGIFRNNINSSRANLILPVGSGKNTFFLKIL